MDKVIDIFLLPPCGRSLEKQTKGPSKVSVICRQANFAQMNVGIPCNTWLAPSRLGRLFDEAYPTDFQEIFIKVPDIECTIGSNVSA